MYQPHPNPPSRARIPGATLCAIALAAILAAGCQSQDSGTPPTAAAKPALVGVYPVQPQRITLGSEMPGRVAAPTVAEVRPQVRGLIQSRAFTEGSQVKAGQLLYQIEPDSYRIALASAQAAVAKAQATLESARLTAKRRSELAKINAVSQQDEQDGQAALKQAEADLAAAIATQDSAALNLKRTAVTAPISGRVDLSTVTPGALVTADQTTALTTVRQTDPIQVDVSQSSAELLRLKSDFAAGRLKRIGAEEVQVKLLLEDGTVYTRRGKLSFSGVSVNTSTGAVTLRALFANPDGLLLPGMYVRAVVETAALDEALVVPQQAVQRDSRGGTSVLVVDEQDTVQRRSVSVGRVFGNGWLVSAGLKGGERVVVEGQQKLKVGDKVQPQLIEPAAAAAPASAASR